MVQLLMIHERFVNFDETPALFWDRSLFNPRELYFDHYGYYFYTAEGWRAKVTFSGSGLVDILTGQYVVDPAYPGWQKWVFGTMKILLRETIPWMKAFEFTVPKGFMFEPRVYEHQHIQSIMVERVMPGEQFVDFDWRVFPHVIYHYQFSPGGVRPNLDHWGVYFISQRGGKATITFHGSGKVDILLGPMRYDEVAGRWVWVGEPSYPVRAEPVVGEKTYTLEVQPGYGFEPRVRSESLIESITTTNALLTQVAGAVTAVIGAVGGGVAGYILKPLDPVVSALIGAGLGAGLGVGVGAAVGLLDMAGVIPIPSLGAAPERLGAPARLGKYLITG